MKNTMRTIAKAGGYEVVCDMNGVVSIYKDNRQDICDSSSAYELIREVKEPEIRAELLKQWHADMVTQTHAEKNSKEVEFHG